MFNSFPAEPILGTVNLHLSDGCYCQLVQVLRSLLRMLSQRARGGPTGRHERLVSFIISCFATISDWELPAVSTGQPVIYTR
ncbi:MAG: hypothetical protein CMJ81_02060 [Planctomycetaceae bacterium]|nr:hypothetical protein [Planctomycetaceae bacterium]